MAEAYSLTCCPPTLVPESILSHKAGAHHGFVSKAMPSWWQKPSPFGLKKRFGKMIWFFSEAKRNGVFASDDVSGCKATSDDGWLGARTCSYAQSHDISTEARRAKTSTEGLFLFFSNEEVQ